MYDLLGRFAKWMRPPGGWMPFVLIIIALLCPIGAMIDSRLDIDPIGLTILSLAGLVAGVIAARLRLSGLWASVVGLVLGVALVLVVVGRLFPPLGLLWQEAGSTLDWLRLWKQGMVGWPLPLASVVEFVGEQSSELSLRLWWWSQSAAAGGTAQDNIILVLTTFGLGWVAAYFAAWQIYRRKRALIGLLPTGVVVTITAFFHAQMALFYQLAFLFCMLWLVAICHLWTQEERWDRDGTDYPGNMGQELLLTLAPWVVLIVLIAGLFPVIRPQKIADAFWSVAEGPWSAVEDFTERAFGPIQGGFQAGTGAEGEQEGLPRAHLLGAGPDLTEQMVMLVQTNDPPPPTPAPEEANLPPWEGPRRYWKSTTFDTYTGRGWENSALETLSSPSGGALEPDLVRQARGRGEELVQNFVLVGRANPLLYAVNEPVRFEQAVEAWWRGPGDLAQVTGEERDYTVISSPLEPNVNELRAAPDSLPPGFEERYLALPETVPQRVLDLAVEVAVGAETSYDRARSIEIFLRTYTYTLELPPPPTDGDLVDYFLFDAQQGYCDYYASAMVVMVRAVGVPARLASGYAQGTYNHQSEQWVVLERDGHSWVEVYFDGLGWVEFEPTAGRPGLTRPGIREAGDVAAHPMPARAPMASFPWALVVIAGVLVLLIAVVVLILRRPSERASASPAAMVRDRQRRLQRWGKRLGAPLRDGQTPHEYGKTLGDTLRQRGEDSRWSAVRQASTEAPGEVEDLTETFVQAQYSQEPLHPRESARIQALWKRLRGYLRWLWMGKK